MVGKPTYEELANRVKTLEEQLEQKGCGGPSEAEEELRAIFEMSLDMICIADIATATFLRVNPAFIETLGYSESELLGRPFLAFVHPEDLQPTIRVVEDSLKKGKTVINFKNRYRTKAGGFRWFNWVSHPLAEKGITIAVAHDITEDFNSREALEESERRFRMMVDFTHSWEYWIGSDRKLVYVSPSCERYTGYSQDEFMRDNDLILALVHPDDRDLLRTHFQNEVQVKRVTNLEFRIVDRLGKERWILHTCQPIYDESGVFLGRRASNREITDQKRAEIEKAELNENLKKTSTLLNTVLDAIPDVIGVQDPQHRIIRYNEAGYRFLGMPFAEVYGRKCYELIGHDDPCPICATSEVYRTKEVARVEKYVPELDKWLDVRAYPVLDERGELSRVIEHLRDITREKMAEAELKNAHERLTTILDSIEAHIYVATLDSYRILFMNQKMKEDFHGDLVGTLCHESFRGEKTPCGHCNNSRLLDAEGLPTGVNVSEGKNPITGRWYVNYERAIRWVDGRMVRIQIATDITRVKEYDQERVQMERQIQQAQKMEAIGTLAGGIAHDFNNLLMGIQGRASLMLADMDSSNPNFEHLRGIEEYVRNAADLTRQLLGFARGGKYEVRVTDLNELIDKSASLFGRTKKEVTLHRKFQPDLWKVEVDRGQIRQVLLNLFVNAWQAMPAGGEIYLQTQNVFLDNADAKLHGVKSAEYVKTSVTDTGVGMDERTKQRLFDPFFTTKGMGRGTGLGLASAYGIIKNHEGFITVYSEKGHGSTFNLYLPASGKGVSKETEPLGELVEGDGTILLVDDEDLILEVGKPLLERLGYRVLTARSGKHAVEVYKENMGLIKAVILDMVMPQMSGKEAFECLKAIDPGAKIILSSGYSINGQAQEILRQGCYGFIQKPFNLRELSQSIGKALAKQG